jgi:cysteine desulfurase
MHKIYLDNASTTLMFPGVLEKMTEEYHYLFGNPSSRFHSAGWEADDKVSEARVFISAFLGASPSELVFTSGSSEGIKMVFNHFFWNKKVHIVTNKTEHKITLLGAESLQKRGWKVTYLPVDPKGKLNFEYEVNNFPKEEHYLFVIMLGNNEIGTIHDLAQFVKDARCNFPNAYILTDATQAVTKLDIDFDKLDVDFLVFSAHKFHGPKGIGGLLVKKGIEFSPFGISEGQERGRRGGTLNVPGIRGMFHALKQISTLSKDSIYRLQEKRDAFEQLISDEINEVRRIGDLEKRLPHISNLQFQGIYSEELLHSFTEVAASNGSACNSANIHPSHVLVAIGLTPELALSCVRFSFSFLSTEEEIEIGAKHVIECIKKRWKK